MYHIWRIEMLQFFMYLYQIQAKKLLCDLLNWNIRYPEPTRISRICFLKWPDIRKNCYPVHPYFITLSFLIYFPTIAFSTNPCSSCYQKSTLLFSIWLMFYKRSKKWLWYCCFSAFNWISKTLAQSWGQKYWKKSLTREIIIFHGLN